MRIYVSVDMEGLAGVAHAHQVSFGPGVDRVDYDRARGLMAAETNAASEAAFERGADEVAVNDSHWQMRNLRAEDLHRAARLIVGDKPYSMTQGIGLPGDGAFDAAAFIGYHAGAGNPRGVIAHTYSSASVLELRVNGVPHNEAAINAIRLGHHGVPVMLVAGDDALAEEVEQLLPWAERVVVKRALGYSGAEALSPYEAALPLHGEVDFRLAVMADYAAVMPGVERIGGRGVAFTAPDGDTFYRTFAVLFRLAG